MIVEMGSIISDIYAIISYLQIYGYITLSYNSLVLDNIKFV